MRHSFKWLWGFIPLALVLWLAMAWQAPLITQDVTTRANAQLKAEGFDWTSLSIIGRDATLAGQALNDDSRALAVSAADRVSGVRLVNDTSALMAPLKPYPLAMQKTGKGIVISGAVPDAGARAALQAQVKAAIADAAITDKTSFQRGAPDGFGPLAAYAAAQLGQLSNGSFSLTDKALTIEGQAPSIAVYEAVSKNVQALPSGGQLVKALITAPSASPYAMAALHDGQTITLSGHVPSDADRKMLTDSVQAAAPKAKIVDSLTIASGSPTGFAAIASHGLAQLGRLQSGKMSLTDTALSIEGIAPDAAAYGAVTTALKTLPVGGRLASAAIVPPTARPYRFEAVNDGKSTTLSGHVGSEKTSAAILAAVKGPHSYNFSAAGGEPAGWVDAVSLGLAQLNALQNGKLAIVDQSVSIEGVAANQATHDAVLAAMKAQPQGFRLANANIAIAKQAVKPYVMALERTGNGLVLKGLVPSEDMHKALVANARSAFPGVNITDQITIADGVPAGMDWLKANGFALQQLGRLKTGMASWRDDVFSISGEAADADSYQAVLNAAKTSGFKTGAVALKLPNASPYVWALEKADASAVAVRGFVPSQEVGRAQGAAIAAAMPGAKIIDELGLANGVPAEFDAATKGVIAQMARLEAGQAQLSDKTLKMVGRAPSIAVKEQVETALNALRNSGIIVSHAITAPAEMPAPPAQAPVTLPPPPINAPPVAAPPISVAPAAVVPAKPQIACQTWVNEAVNGEIILFVTGSERVRGESRALLKRVADVLNKCPEYRVTIEGHTDSDGPEDLNRRLSMGRAEAVREALIDLGVAENRLNGEGFGPTRPVAPNDTAENKAKNRRIEFVIKE